jgi:hypothetical protein
VPADLTSERDRMVDSQIAGRGIADRHVLDAMRRVPRERFVAPGFEEFAYEDTPLPIDEGQTISQPYIVALMIEAAAVRPGDKVLDVGTGSGYAAAVVSLIADHVYTIERHEALAQTTRSTSTPSAWSDSIRSLAPVSRATSTTETRSRTSWPAHPISRATLSCISDFAAQWIRFFVSAGARLPIGYCRVRNSAFLRLSRRRARSVLHLVAVALGAVMFRWCTVLRRALDLLRLGIRLSPFCIRFGLMDCLDRIKGGRVLRLILFVLGSGCHNATPVVNGHVTAGTTIKPRPCSSPSVVMSQERGGLQALARGRHDDGAAESCRPEELVRPSDVSDAIERHYV